MRMLQKGFSVALGLSCLLSVGTASAITIDFESLPATSNAIENSPVTTQGFTTGSSHYHIIDNPAGFGGADNGSARYLGEEDGSLGVDIVMTEASGGTFDLNAFDGAELFVNAPGGYPNATFISVLGSLFGGGTVSQVFALDGLIDGAGGVADFQTFSLSAAFTNLVSVTFSGLIPADSGTGGFAIDNIVVNESGVGVPEPGTLVLFGLSLLGISAFARKKV